MRNLKTIGKKVRAVLEKNEDARNDDMVLYLALCNACLKDAGAMPLAEIMTRSTNILVCRALRASAGHAASCRHSIQSLQGAALFKK